MNRAQIISHICERRLQVHYPKASKQMPNPGLLMGFLKIICISPEVDIKGGGRLGPLF